MPGAPDLVYVRARSVLLDALEALAEHSDAVILVGAQAIYLHVGDGELSTAPYTTDGDLVLTPDALGPSPLVDQLMRGAGFLPSPSPDQIGTWIGSYDVPIDLLVPSELAGPGRRAARLGPHGDRTARRAHGLEAAIIDTEVMTLRALAATDDRQIRVRIAGPTALLIAKLHKLADRQSSPGRQDDKDALDVYRLLQAIPTRVFAAGMRVLLNHSLSSVVTAQAQEHLMTLFASFEADGCQMAARAVELLDDPDTVAASCAALTQDLLDALEPSATP